MKRLVIVILIFTYSCTGDKSGSGDHQDHINMGPQIDNNFIEPLAQTREMINKTAEAVDRIIPSEISYYLNAKRAEMYKKQLENLKGTERMQLEVKYASELLSAGNTPEAIATLEKLLNQLKSVKVKNSGSVELYIKKLLALSYMRKAEQDNCINNHTNVSCIIPIQKRAVHKNKEGSQKSIKLLEEILAKNLADKDCKYLLNIAYMTLGEYPQSVPSQYRIDPNYFEKSMDFTPFTDVASNLGVGTSKLSGGTCVDDFNGDGYLDIIASSWGFDHNVQYFENDRKGGFIDRTFAVGLKGVSGGLNLRHADYNNDGHMDFFILRGAWFFDQGKIPNSLIRNNGDGTFTDVTIEAGLYSEYPTQTAVWEDFNVDGWLDLFIANESNEDSHAPCELFISNGDGTFTETSEAAGIKITGFFKGVSSGDINNDGLTDLYISTMGSDNHLLINTPKDNKVSFTSVGKLANVTAPKVSFPTWMFDYNNDGFTDIFVSGYSFGSKSASSLMFEGVQGHAHPQRPFIYRNNGNGTFSEVSAKVGLTEPIVTMGCNFGDLDNDGFKDFYLATGEPNLFSIVPNRMYRNNAGFGFQDVTYKGGFGHIQKGHAVGFGDLDMDGDQDIYTVMGGAFEGDVFQNILFENPSGNNNNWVNIKLEGVRSNRSAIGAKIILELDENEQYRKIYHRVESGASFGGNSLLAEIGVGETKVIKRISVIWPIRGGTLGVYENVPVNKNLKITEGQSKFEEVDLPATKFSLGNGGHHHHHH